MDEAQERWLDRAPVSYNPVEDALTIRASALGACTVALLTEAFPNLYDGDPADLEPVPPPPQVLKAMQESADLERQAIDMLVDKGHKVSSNAGNALSRAVSTQDPTRIQSVTLTGTPDAWGWTGELIGQADLIYEVKILSPKAYNEAKDKAVPPSYLLQLASYLWMKGLPPDNGRLAIFEKSNGALTGNFFTRDATARDLLAMLNRVNDLAEMASDSLLAGTLPTCTGAGDWCRMGNVHSRPELDPLLVGTYVSMQRLEAKIKDLTVQRDAHKQELTDAVRTHTDQKAQLTLPGGQVVKFTWVESHVKEKEPREYDRKYLRITKPK